MKYVIDASVALKWLVPEVDTDRALRLLDGFQNAIHDLIAPDILPVETTHALTRAERQGRITTARGNQLFIDFLNQLPQLHSCLPLLPKAYALSSTVRQGVYDSLYVALAEREQCELVTADDKLVKNMQAAYPFIIALSSLP
jgi:predicted nucleic acid-binding protein